MNAILRNALALAAVTLATQAAAQATFYENEGYKAGVIYSCGAVVKGKDLFVYYGGADMVTCVAATDLDLFLKDLVSTGIVKMKKGRK